MKVKINRPRLSEPLLFVFLLSILFSSSSQQSPPPSPVGFGYNLVAVDDGEGEISAKLRLISESPVYGSDIPNLEFHASFQTDDRLRVRITDADHRRWEIPDDIIPRREDPNRGIHHTPEFRRELAGDDGNVAETHSFTAEGSDLVLNLRNTTPFSFSVSRKSTGDVLFDTQIAGDPGVVFKDQYLQISSSLPGDRSSLYGLGEHTKPTFRLVPNETFTLWNSDIAASNVDLNLYGSHPFYMDVRSPDGVAHGVLLLNSNGMDVDYQGSRIVYKVIGGVFDFYFFAGSTPLAVVYQYVELVGRPAPMPYWSFGFHQCHYGYKNVSELEAVVENYKKANIPLEVMWTDIDYMDGFKDFTLDPVNFPPEKMKEFVEKLHSDGQKYIVIIDPGISVNTSYATFQRGILSGIFLKNFSGEYYRGVVWPGDVYFPDFFHPNASDFWAEEIDIFRRNLLAVDGLWIDMNEISNFIDPPPVNRFDDPPYKINNSGDLRPLSNRTVPASAIHYGNLTEYDVHNLFGLLESKATSEGLLKSTGKRPFVLSRSTFVGSGKFAAHWTGDNAATWQDLAYSITQVLNFGIFGVPMVGADICGFNGNTTEELCRRWIQVGAFYPFARNHYAKGSISHELYIWPSVAAAARKALGLRYRLLPYFYSLMYSSHRSGAPIARPLFFSFPEDPRTLDIDAQFLVGDKVLVSPVLTPATNSVTAYFPAGTWYNLFNQSKKVVAGPGGADVVLDAPPEEVNVHVVGGSVLPMHVKDESAAAILAAVAGRSGFELLAALDADGAAAGELFVDDGESPEMGGESSSDWSFVRFAVTNGDEGLRLKTEVVNGGFALGRKMVVEKIVFLGVKANRRGRISATTKINGVFVEEEKVRVELKEEGEFGIAEVGGLQLPIGEAFELELGFSN